MTAFILRRNAILPHTHTHTHTETYTHRNTQRTSKKIKINEYKELMQKDVDIIYN